MKESIAVAILGGPIILGMYCMLGYMVGFIEAAIYLGSGLLIVALICGWFQFAWYIIEKYIE
jgi:hypothetical protein